MINIVMPMAGFGTRFSEKGYTLPKPMIDVKGKPMFRHVIDQLEIQDAKYYFGIRMGSIDVDELQRACEGLDHKIVAIPNYTEGAAITTRMITQEIDNDDPIIVVNCDNIIHLNHDDLKIISHCDGIIFVFENRDGSNAWSYTRVDSSGHVKEVAEKKVISNYATAGAYVWKNKSLFINACNKMVQKNIRTNNEFYLAPVYNENINCGQTVVAKEVKHFRGIGTPDDLESYINEQ